MIPYFPSIKDHIEITLGKNWPLFSLSSLFRLLQILEPETVRITALFQTSFVPDYTWHIGEILAYVFLGIMCGVGGALFVNCHRRLV